MQVFVLVRTACIDHTGCE